MGCGASAPAPIEPAADITVDCAAVVPQEDQRGTTQSVREANHASDIRPTALDPGTDDALTRSRLLWARDTALLEGTSSKAEKHD